VRHGTMAPAGDEFAGLCRARWSSRDVSALADGAGAANETRRHTRGTDVITLLNFVLGQICRIWPRGGAYPLFASLEAAGN